VRDTLFSFRGRIARLRYFGYGCLAGLIAVLLITGGGVAFYLGRTVSTTGTPGAGLVVVACLLILAGLVCAGWARLALTIKRLHDIGLIGTHVIWILLLDLSSSLVARASLGVGLLLELASVGVSLWLLFQPGQDTTNRYGPVPGGPTTPPAQPTGAAPALS